MNKVYRVKKFIPPVLQAYLGKSSKETAYFLILDRKFNILYVNPIMEEWYRHQMPLIGKKCYEAYYGARSYCKK